MAYPENVGIQGAWSCSSVLKAHGYQLVGECVDNDTYRDDHGVVHTKDLPFMYYEVKSEQQPSARGATTRPNN